jgi:hypothetical protein
MIATTAYHRPVIAPPTTCRCVGSTHGCRKTNPTLFRLDAAKDILLALTGKEDVFGCTPTPYMRAPTPYTTVFPMPCSAAGRWAARASAAAA